MAVKATSRFLSTRIKLGLVVRIQFGDSRSLFLIIERIRRMFDLSADWQAIATRLRSDPVLARGIERSPGLRVPGSWDGFELAVRAILGQQVTVKGASALAAMMASKFGRPVQATGGLTHLFPTPQVLGDAKLFGVGLTKARAETIRPLARAVSGGQIQFDRIAAIEPFLDRLCEIPGIGNWTAQYIAMRALGEPDAFPSTDLGLLRVWIYKMVASLNAERKRGGPGVPMQRCICGMSPANDNLARAEKLREEHGYLSGKQSRSFAKVIGPE